jgi:uncharacterized protein YjiS (DUF1127 family)
LELETMMLTLFLDARSRSGSFVGWPHCRPRAPDAERSDAPKGFWATLAGWLDNRAARRQLLRYQALDRRFARDIDLAPGDIVFECAKPFWVAVGANPLSAHAAAEAEPTERRWPCSSRRRPYRLRPPRESAWSLEAVHAAGNAL